jgi:hypothetical protein
VRPKSTDCLEESVSDRTSDAGRTETPAYLEDVINVATSAELKPGTVQHVNVSHDSWCDLRNRRGACNCQPDVQLVKPS